MADGPRTYLGIQSAGVPNLFLANSAAFCNFPRCAEMVVEWVSECIRYLREKDFARIAATPQAEEAWTEHANELAAGTLLTQANSWFVGANIPGKKRAFLLIASAAKQSLPKKRLLRREACPERSAAESKGSSQ